MFLLYYITITTLGMPIFTVAASISARAVISSTGLPCRFTVNEIFFKSSTKRSSIVRINWHINVFLHEDESICYYFLF